VVFLVGGGGGGSYGAMFSWGIRGLVVILNILPGISVMGISISLQGCLSFVLWFRQPRGLRRRWMSSVFFVENVFFGKAHRELFLREIKPWSAV
jgi:hypothetical protein